MYCMKSTSRARGDRVFKNLTPMTSYLNFFHVYVVIYLSEKQCADAMIICVFCYIYIHMQIWRYPHVQFPLWNDSRPVIRKRRKTYLQTGNCTSFRYIEQTSSNGRLSKPVPCVKPPGLDLEARPCALEPFWPPSTQASRTRGLSDFRGLRV